MEFVDTVKLVDTTCVLTVSPLTFHPPVFSNCTNPFMSPLVRFCSSAKVYPHQDGTLQTAINHPVRFLHKLPDSCTYEQASLVEPLSVALHAARRASIAPGQSILVLGAGAVGILACSVASAYGATHIVISDM